MSRVSESVADRRAFQDARGLWWIFRRDDGKQYTPLGPFYTQEYAEDTEREVALYRRGGAPFPATFSHPHPARPFKTPKKLRFA